MREEFYCTIKLCIDTDLKNAYDEQMPTVVSRVACRQWQIHSRSESPDIWAARDICLPATSRVHRRGRYTMALPCLPGCRPCARRKAAAGHLSRAHLGPPPPSPSHSTRSSAPARPPTSAAGCMCPRAMTTRLSRRDEDNDKPISAGCAVPQLSCDPAGGRLVVWK